MESLPFPVSCPLYSEMTTAVATARAAAPLIMQHYGQVTAVDFKSGHEPVTMADRECSSFVTAHLQDAFPHDAILSEEEADDLGRLDNARVWIVDPLDGTREFIDGLEQFVIMMGLAVHGQPHLGVVLQPATGRLLVGIVGWGAFEVHAGRTQDLHVGTHASAAPQRVAVSRSHLTPLMKDIITVLGITQRTRIGSVGLKMGLLAKRQVDGYFHASRGIKEWDLCGPAAMLLAAGGMLTDCWGRKIRFNQRDVRITHGLIATSGPRHKLWVDAIRATCEAHGYTRQTGFVNG